MEPTQDEVKIDKGYVDASYDKILHLRSEKMYINPYGYRIDKTIKEVSNYTGIVFKDYACILISAIFDDSIDNTILGDMLADYVDGGGNVVLCAGSNMKTDPCKYPEGRFTTYHPFELRAPRKLEKGGDTLDICVRDHPIMNNVNTLTYPLIGTIDGEGIQGDTEVLGKWKKDGGNIIGVRYDKNGMITSLGFCYDDEDIEGDHYELLKNALRYRKHK